MSLRLSFIKKLLLAFNKTHIYLDIEQAFVRFRSTITATLMRQPH